MKRLILILALLLASPAGADEPPHRHGYIPRPEDLTLSPRQEIPPPPGTADVPNRPLGVQEAVDVALLHQPALVIARGNLKSAQGRTRQVQAGLNPTVNLSATETPISTSLSNSTGGAGFNSASFVSSTGLQATVTARQLLFDFEKTRQSVAQARAQEKATLETLAQTHNDVVLQVEQAFYTCLSDEQLIAVNETDVNNQREHQQQAEALYRSGIGKPADVVRAENAVATALVNLKQAQGDADNARVALAHSMGIDPRTPLQLAAGDLTVPEDKPLPELIDQALASRPEVLSASATVEADRHGIAAATHNNAPSVSAGAGVTTLPNPVTAGQQLSLLTATLNLQWNFGDGGVTAGQIEEANGALEAAQGQLNAARSQVITEVTQAYVNLKTAEEKLRLSNVAVSTGEENLKLERGRYKAGLGLAIDVLDAESALLQAMTSRVTQQAAVDQARAALAHALGLGQH